MRLYKTTIVIWSEYDPFDPTAHVEIDELAREACVGDAYCSDTQGEWIDPVEADPAWDGTEFFGVDES